MPRGPSILLLSLLLGACTVGPNYRTPEVALPTEYSEKQNVDVEGSLKQWWTQFDDPLLDDLIAEAIQNNFDLRIAEEKINENRALYRVQRSKLFPEIDLDGSATRTRYSINTPEGEFITPLTQNFFMLGFDATWELDFFGKIRRQKEAAARDLEAMIENKRDVQVTLLGETARIYITIRGFQERIALTEQRIQVQKQLCCLSEELYAEGLTDLSQVAQDRALLESLIAELSPLESALKQNIFQLAFLLGKAPEQFEKTFQNNKQIPCAAGKVPLDLPSTLLQRRPDIRQAERKLAAETARIGAAKADFFPQFFLTGSSFGTQTGASSWGFQSSKMNNFFTAPSQSWSFGPGMTLPLFTAGRISANVQAQTSRQKQALLSFEQTVISALKDVESTLVAYGKEQERYQSLTREVESSKQVWELADARYKAGLVDLSQVLTAQEDLFSKQDALIQSKETLMTNLVALYKALGGGWESK